ncbi:MAG: NINE protein [Muribaculaceae bacterium]|nr:NINE protein [Muribaculaceae bacterium]
MANLQCPYCRQMFTTMVNAPQVQCPHCGNIVNTGMGYQQPNQQPYQQQQFYQQPQYAYGQQSGNVAPSGKDHIVAGILCLLLGGLGIHYFYCGKAGAGVICLLLTFISCGIWGVLLLIQGIMMLTMSQEEFDRKYVYSTSSFPLF